MCAFLGSPYGAPAHRKVPGARPERGADRMSAPDLRGRMPRKISAGSRNRGCAGGIRAIRGGLFFGDFSLAAKRQSHLPWVSPPQVTRRPRGGSTRLQGKAMSEQSVLEKEVARLIVEALNLEEVKPDQIAPEAPLFRQGLGLDSIDALELALALSNKYGFKLRSDDEKNKEGFSSLRALVRHVEQHRQH